MPTPHVCVEVIQDRVFRTRVEEMGTGYVAIVDELAAWPNGEDPSRAPGVRIWSGRNDGALRPTAGLVEESARRAIATHVDSERRVTTRRRAI